ncbi:acyltransferase [Frateuria defendens]|uniref:acyltransferase n=1 Tax=Frateuria defendens TaxID=2219559 RepID=UPI00066FE5AC|nr:acyltransferase [Frateuria defendens]
MGLRAWLANGVAASALIPSRLRRLLLAGAGARIGRSAIMHGGHYGGDLSKLRIGDYCYLNIGVSLHPTGGIAIGDRVALGPHVLVFTGTHEVGPAARRAANPPRFAPVVIGDGCWLGAGVIVHPGVTIGPGCIVASGAVVVADCAPNGLYAGVPAVRKKDLDPA